MRMHSFLLASIATLAGFVLAQDGSLSGPTTDPSQNKYSCDPNQCKLPSCRCASTDIPGGIAPSDTPMFLVVTADDAVQSYTINAITNLLGHRQNPNGCNPVMTYFTQISYTNFSAVTEWYMAGNEIADHTMTHPELGGSDEIDGNIVALNALAGIPLSEIAGFRAPFLNYSADMLKNLKAAGFTYDSSATASLPVNASQSDAYWPYTLDNGLNNDCQTFDGICNGEPKIPGFWTIPMYAIFDGSPNGIHLMDPWLDGTPANVSLWMKQTFTDHYNGNRQPFGLYTHPIHIATGYPGVADPTETINMINEFIDWATRQPDVWIVNNKQLLEWVQNPVPASQLNTLKSFQCAFPNVTESICNGMHPNEDGLLAHCAFPDFPFFTCYGCPGTPPTPANPNPSQPAVSGKVRARLPANCSTAFWDPIGNKCLCETGTSCQFTDGTRPIGPNGANLSSGQTQASASAQPYIPFSGGGMPGAGFLNAQIDATMAIASVLTVAGVVLGAYSVFA